MITFLCASVADEAVETLLEEAAENDEYATAEMEAEEVTFNMQVYYQDLSCFMKYFKTPFDFFLWANVFCIILH